MVKLTTMPVKSLKLFLTSLIDYAGLFPPAKLKLEPALNNFRNDIKCADNWILSQFIIPLIKLQTITDEMMRGFSHNTPLKLSILTNDLNEDISLLNHFKNKFGVKVEFSGLESQIVDFYSFHRTLEKTNLVQNKNQLKMFTFFELPPHENWINNMKKSVEKIAVFNNNSKVKFKAVVKKNACTD